MYLIKMYEAIWTYLYDMYHITSYSIQSQCIALLDRICYVALLCNAKLICHHIILLCSVL